MQKLKVIYKYFIVLLFKDWELAATSLKLGIFVLSNVISYFVIAMQTETTPLLLLVICLALPIYAAIVFLMLSFFIISNKRELSKSI